MEISYNTSLFFLVKIPLNVFQNNEYCCKVLSIFRNFGKFHYKYIRKKEVIGSQIRRAGRIF